MSALASWALMIILIAGAWHGAVAAEIITRPRRSRRD